MIDLLTRQPSVLVMQGNLYTMSSQDKIAGYTRLRETYRLPVTK